jgi:hypothetical protein
MAVPCLPPLRLAWLSNDVTAGALHCWNTVIILQSLSNIVTVVALHWWWMSFKVYPTLSLPQLTAGSWGWEAEGEGGVSYRSHPWLPGSQGWCAGAKDWCAITLEPCLKNMIGQLYSLITSDLKVPEKIC